MKLSIFGPNLHDQSKGQHVVHATGCADCAKLRRRGEYESVEEHATVESVVKGLYSCQMEEGCTFDECLGEMHFAPCTDALPLRDGNLSKADRADEAKDEHKAWIERHS